jgi:2-keto-3-deoxy-L-arabinonate dehydratase
MTDSNKRLAAGASAAMKSFAGVFPVAPTVFAENGDLDLPGQLRVLDCMIDQGVDGICILANYSEQFSLDDRERAQLTDSCLAHVAGRVPVIVTISHFSTRQAVSRATHAARAGASMLMLMPPFYGANLKAAEQQAGEQFAEVALAGGGIPIMVQDAPLSGVALSVQFLASLARESPRISYFKIEVPGAAAKLRALIELGAESILGPFDGEESITLMADLDAGATGTMSSALLPDQIAHVVRHFRAGRRDEAAHQYQRILPLINFENRQCGLIAAKTIMMEGGVIHSDTVRHPLQPLHPATRHGLLELAREINPLALTWGR